MARISEERRQEMSRATVRAKKYLKRGDIVTVTKCPGTKRWIKFDHFYRDEIFSSSHQGEYHAINISKVNGKPISFRD